MVRIWTRTRRYLAALWLGAAVLELGLLELMRRTNNSWLLLMGAGILLVPLVATERTFQWLGRAPRVRWKRHDVEDALAAAAADSRPGRKRGARYRGV
jgi:hypothetical protein